MPRKVMVVAGPSSFSIATGMPRLLQPGRNNKDALRKHK